MSLARALARHAGVALGLLAVGCASPRAATSVTAPELSRGRHVDQVWFDREAIRPAGNVTVAEAEARLDQALRAAGDPIVLARADAGREARLDVAITELDPGSTMTRFWAGELGAGHAWVQVEARLTDAATGARIGALAERGRASGVATFRNSRGRDSGPGLVRDLLERIAGDIRQELSAELGAAAG